MARLDDNRTPAKRQRSSEPSLTLSTGRFEGRPTASGTTPQSNHPRHNPLRDQYPSRAERDQWQNRARQSQQRRGGARNTQSVDERKGHEGNRAPHDKKTRQTYVGGNHAGSTRSLTLDARTAILVGIVIILLIACIAVFTHLGSFGSTQVENPAEHVGSCGLTAVAENGSFIAQNVAAQVSLARPIEPDLEKQPTHTTTSEEIASLSDQKAPFVFAFNTTDSQFDTGAALETGADDATTSAPVLSDRSLVSLNNALAFYDANGYDVGYLLMDLGTGRGIAGNLDASVYGASSFKGPYCAYIAQVEFPSDIDTVSENGRSLMENTITWSDNASYGELRRIYGDDDMRAWLTDAGVDPSLVDDTYFPTYTVRDSALMWLKIYQYLSTANSATSNWFSDLLTQTEVSFLRNGALGTTSAGQTDYLPEEGTGGEEGIDDNVESNEEPSDNEAQLDSESDDIVYVADASSASSSTTTSEGKEIMVESSDDDNENTEESSTVASIGTNIAVRNKAGWIDGETDDAICDSGIVTINGRDYLMTIMSSAPDSAEGEQAFGHLARTLFEIRSDLI